MLFACSDACSALAEVVAAGRLCYTGSVHECWQWGRLHWRAWRGGRRRTRIYRKRMLMAFAG